MNIKFESFIKHTDDISINHPLRDFSEKLENEIKSFRFIPKDTDKVKNSHFLRIIDIMIYRNAF